jgi:ATP-dependent protease ClpP protease subunit
MMSSRRSASTFVTVALVVVACVCTPVTAQSNAVIISFVGGIDSGSMAGLLRTVNEQIQKGNKDITLLIASPGGDTTAAFAAYNVLRNVPAEITTFNIGNVDSAAMLLYCAGKKRYSMPATRFLIHGNSFNSSSQHATGWGFAKKPSSNRSKA